MKTYFYLLLFFFTILSIGQTRIQARVVGVKDGDTVVVLDSLHNQSVLRLAEVDCPEKNQPFGYKAKQFTSDAIYNRMIHYTVIDTDRYGREIAMIFYDDDQEYLSAEIIKAGMGWHYKRYSTSEVLAALENEARDAKRGLWVDNNAIAPHKWRNR